MSRSTQTVAADASALAQTLWETKYRFGQERSVEDSWRRISRAVAAVEGDRGGAYGASAALAQEKGSFPAFRREPYLEASFVQRLPGHLRNQIARNGIRNSHLLAIAPTGSISLLAGNVSSGLEPIYAPAWRRTLATPAGPRTFELIDAAVAAWRACDGDDSLPPAFVRAEGLTIDDHFRMQAALQPFVDSAISKTVTVAEDCPFDVFSQAYELAYDLGPKGCTLYRPNPVTGAVLHAEPSARCAGPGQTRWPGSRRQR